MTTSYEAIGGEEKIRSVLRSLYDQLFVDPMVGFLFEGKDKEHIVKPTDQDHFVPGKSF